MKNGLIATAILCLAASTALAAPLTPEQALARAKAEAPLKIKGVASAPTLVHTAMQQNGNAALYVFDTHAGYMVLSADDIAIPVLGYADNDEHFDATQMAPAMQWWLSEYAGEIEYALTHNTDANQSMAYNAVLTASRAERKVVPPMCNTNWDQGAPYNNQCPLSGTRRTFTGCVATAMAQVMKHYNYPERGQGSITYTAQNLNKSLSMNFATEAFDWDNMLNDYHAGQYNTAQANAVAYLMKACGYSVKMNYGLDASGTISMYIANAMYKYFNYDGNIRYLMRMMYSPTEWENMVYENLANVGPLVYNGNSMVGGGHSFVCDGYDGEGFFHFNWGWSSTSNGYFALTALAPDNLGTGGGGGGGYNFAQDAVFGIQPPQQGVETVLQPDMITQMGSLTATISGSRLTFGLQDYGQMWCNYSSNSIRFQIGAKLVKADSDAEPVYKSISTRIFELSPGYGSTPSAMQPYFDLSSMNLQDGTYFASMVWRFAVGTDTQWKAMQCPYGAVKQVRIVKNGSTYTVEDSSPKYLTISSATISEPLYYGCLCDVEITVTNPYDYEICSGFAPILSDGSQIAFMGESIMLTVPAGQTISKKWTTSLTQLINISQFTSPKTYYFSLMDEESYHNYSSDVYKQITMQPNPGKPSVRLKGIPTITGAKRSGLTSVTYTVTEPAQMEISANISVTAGYFGYNVMACLCKENGDGTMDILTYGTVPMTIEAGKEAPFKTTLSYPQAEVGQSYILVFTYATSTSLEMIQSSFSMTVKIAQSGTENTIADSPLKLHYDDNTGIITATSDADIASVEAYNTAGALVATVKATTPEVILPLRDLAPGLLIVKAVDANGQSATLKVVR